MAELRAIRTEYVLHLTHDEFRLLFRAVGKAAGAKVGFDGGEVQALRDLNVKLADTRVKLIAQMQSVAEGALESAEGVKRLPVPPDEKDDDHGA